MINSGIAKILSSAYMRSLGLVLALSLAGHALAFAVGALPRGVSLSNRQCVPIMTADEEPSNSGVEFENGEFEDAGFESDNEDVVPPPPPPPRELPAPIAAFVSKVQEAADAALVEAQEAARAALAEAAAAPQRALDAAKAESQRKAEQLRDDLAAIPVKATGATVSAVLSAVGSVQTDAEAARQKRDALKAEVERERKQILDRLRQ